MIEKAKKILNDENATLVLVKGEEAFIDKRKGIVPVLDLVDKGTYEGYYACDLIVGKAAALLYVLLKVSAVHAVVITNTAKTILENAGIIVTYDTLTDRIINRDKTDICPMEKAVETTNDAVEAYHLIKEKLNQLKQKGTN